MCDIEGDGEHEADDEGVGYPLVGAAGGEDLFCEAAPGDGLRVVGLWALAGLDVGAFDGDEDLALVFGDGVHEDIGEDAADDCSPLFLSLVNIEMRDGSSRLTIWEVKVARGLKWVYCPNFRSLSNCCP